MAVTKLNCTLVCTVRLTAITPDDAAAVTVWLNTAVSPQRSLTCQVRVMTAGQGPPLVMVLRTTTRLLPPQGLTNAGGSKLQADPHGTALFVGAMTCGATKEVLNHSASPTAA